jgi:hypothetical protein
LFTSFRALYNLALAFASAQQEKPNFNIDIVENELQEMKPLSFKAYMWELEGII